MVRANVSEIRANLSHFMLLAKSGETVIICERNQPVAELIAVRPPADLALRESAIGMFRAEMSEGPLDEALPPLTADEVNALMMGR